ncbi:MAG: Fe-S-containing protein [Synergistes jonesii]|uniref:Fe-S-containing protein n=1 Tax=Synergistes jonesii TaxID=2754 RepID=UPI002A756A22|nr:Fe-S-containing protein [Synergistes jonesii]MDY2984933.1 Fe-S-containing protein [Synergistes jonesii]
MEVSSIFKYLVAVTDHLATLSLLTGIILSFAAQAEGKAGRRIVWAGVACGFLLGCALFGVRMWDPKGMNLILMSFNRWVVAAIAAAAAAAALSTLFLLTVRRTVRRWESANLPLLSALEALSLMYLTSPVIQFTQEFVYFGESGVSTNVLLRAIGFTLGVALCLLLSLSSFQVHRALNGRGGLLFLFGSVILFFLEYGVAAVAALQRLKAIPLTDFVFKVMIFGDSHKNAFIFAQLALAIVMLAWVVMTHQKPTGEFANKALLRKEKARLRNCRRWSWSLLVWGVAVIFVVVVLHYLDTRPPAEVTPEGYALENGVITIPLEQVSDGHLHKFSYETPNGYEVRFLVVKKPIGMAYGLGLDACEICGIAGYYERGEEEIVCRRCDVVMNKNTIGFHGGCNPIPFPYEIRESNIFINVKDLEANEKRFR